MRKLSRFWPALACAFVFSHFAHAQTLVLEGGAQNPVPVVAQRFVDLAGGAKAKFVLIPSSTTDARINSGLKDYASLFGTENFTILHTQDRKVADSQEFVAPLKTATGVWFTGGKPALVLATYLHTRTQEELQALLARGGVIGGSSAGAMVLGSYVVRGGRGPDSTQMAPGDEEGFGFLQGVAINPHFIQRHQEEFLVGIVATHPELLGIGIDPGAAIVAHAGKCDVIGDSKVAVYDGKDHDGKKYYFLTSGDRYDLTARERVAGLPRLQR